MAAVAPAINRIVAARVDRRPDRSARTPNSSEPSGRNRQAIAKTANTVVNPAHPPGVSTAAMSVADPANSAKSYHSIALPAQTATSTLRRAATEGPDAGRTGVVIVAQHNHPG